MVLNGIGGKSIEEAKQNLSHEEVCRWALYRQKRGSLNLGLRVERAAGLLAYMLANWHRKEGTEPFTIHDFAPHLDVPETTIEEMKKWE